MNSIELIIRPFLQTHSKRKLEPKLSSRVGLAELLIRKGRTSPNFGLIAPLEQQVLVV